MEKLPAVAKNTYYPCSKCEADRYHRVLAHLSATEARLQCEVCGSKRKMKIGAKASTKVSVTRKTTKAPTSSRGAAAHANLWQELKEKYGDIPAETYALSGDYRAHSLIQHPLFGIGVVTHAHPNKIEVCFEQGVKTLLHRRA